MVHDAKPAQPGKAWKCWFFDAGDAMSKYVEGKRIKNRTSYSRIVIESIGSKKKNDIKLSILVDNITYK